MSAKTKKYLNRITGIFFGAIITVALLGLIFFPRPNLPAPVTDDYCKRYNIHFDGTSIEKIYLAPESILADPETFLQGDPAYLLFGKARAKLNNPFPFQEWLHDIQALASKPMVEREKEIPYRLYSLIMANQESFCREVRRYVLEYLPVGTTLEVTIYLTALEGSNPAESFSDGQITFSLSHPLYTSAARLYKPTGLSAFYNSALHELTHIGFSEHFDPPTLEEHMQNEVVIDMLMSLHNEGMATYTSYQLNIPYPLRVVSLPG